MRPILAPMTVTRDYERCDYRAECQITGVVGRGPTPIDALQACAWTMVAANRGYAPVLPDRVED